MAESDEILDFLYPYRDRYEIHRQLPVEGVGRERILAELDEIAAREDEPTHTGKVSGSLYHGGEEHFAFLAEVYRRFSHMNVLQRDMYPSATKFEGEIISMALGLLGAGGPPATGDSGAAKVDEPVRAAAAEACGVLTSGGSESLITALLTYRERAASAASPNPRWYCRRPPTWPCSRAPTIWA